MSDATLTLVGAIIGGLFGWFILGPYLVSLMGW